MRGAFALRVFFYFCLVPIVVFYVLSAVGCTSTELSLPELFLVKVVHREFEMRVGYVGICLYIYDAGPDGDWVRMCKVLPDVIRAATTRQFPDMYDAVDEALILAWRYQRHVFAYMFIVSACFFVFAVFGTITLMLRASYRREKNHNMPHLPPIDLGPHKEWTQEDFPTLKTVIIDAAEVITWPDFLDWFDQYYAEQQAGLAHRSKHVSPPVPKVDGVVIFVNTTLWICIILSALSAFGTMQIVAGLRETAEVYKETYRFETGTMVIAFQWVVTFLNIGFWNGYSQTI